MLGQFGVENPFVNFVGLPAVTERSGWKRSASIEPDRLNEIDVPDGSDEKEQRESDQSAARDPSPERRLADEPSNEDRHGDERQ